MNTLPWRQKTEQKKERAVWLIQQAFFSAFHLPPNNAVGIDPLFEVLTVQSTRFHTIQSEQNSCMEIFSKAAWTTGADDVQASDL